MPTDPGWPRSYTDGSANLVVYNPQVDGWKDFKTLHGRCAFALTPAPGREPLYGTFHFQSDTLVDADQKIVLLRNIRVSDMRFPSGSSVESSELTRKMLPTSAMVVSLDRIIAYVKASEAPKREARVLSEPPPIHVSYDLAILVIIDGEPVLLDIEGTSLQKVVNTNWDLYRDKSTNRYFLRHNDAWLAAAERNGPYTVAMQLPTDLARFSAPTTSAQSRIAATPRVIVTTQPAELIAINGLPKLARIAGTDLSLVENTESDLFYHASLRAWYFLAAGRWFTSPSLKGPWQSASLTLPADFRRIPADHARARVLASVPGTREAEDAVLLASIPRTAVVQRHQAKAEVHYTGAPQFEAIQGTSISYARNTPSDVLRIGNRYYLCQQGVWFTGASAQGPWAVADAVPQEIYSIPESSPKYNVTYVKVYDSTPETIVVGYTPGYYGAYVAGGVVVWGTGYYYPPYVAVGVTTTPVYWGSSVYTYGAGAWYNPASGIYTRGSAVYGPNGGYGAGAAYNPRTGTYAQGAAAYGPNGGAAAARTYNPYTGVASAGYNATNPYGSWGEGVVSNGSNWARGGYQSNSRGTVATGQTSAGGKGVAVEGTAGNSGYLARSGSGDVYAGSNGNVYKREDGQWYQNQNGSWNSVDKSALDSHKLEALARDRGSRNAELSEKWNANRAAASGRLEQRPRPSGRRR
ncbi:MAG: hypothetical protein U0R19_12275 [Bryobacteraceae bacterium]